jgi:hypothetical protein
MVSYPVYVPRPSYRGNDKKKVAKHAYQLALISRLEQAINEAVALQTRRYQSYLWHHFTTAVGASDEEIARIGYAIDGGSNGFTVYRPELPEN